MPKEKVKINVKERLDENVLDLSLSEIEHIPVKDIASLRRATVIDLSSNNIRFLPKNFGSSLSHIVRLDLSKNHLKYLTDDFCNLINLKHLDLYNNQLENLPVYFGKLTKLRYLDLKGNPLSPSLQKVVGPCLTLKDCQNASKNIVPFMEELLKKIQVEQRRKEEEEEKRKQEELQELKEQIRLAKKAARKERKKNEKAQNGETQIEGNGEIRQSNASSVKLNIPKSSSCSVFRIIGYFLFIVVVILAVAIVAFPTSINNFLSYLPPNYQSIVKQFLN